MKKYNWAILGAGTIANEMAQALHKVNGEIYAVGNRSKDKAVAFAKKYQVQKVYENYHDMFTDPLVDIIYIATPHNSHYEYLMEAVKNGKHVLCEKAITINDEQLFEVLKIAKENKVQVMEAMTIYHMPLYKRLKEIIQSGAIGKVKLVQVNFGSCKEYDVNNRFFSKELAGGALLDIGVYAMSFARYFINSKPEQILTTVNYFETGVDEESGILMKNREGQMVVTALTMRAKQPKRGVIAGEKGFIEVENYPRAHKATITYTADGHVETIEVGAVNKALAYEVEAMQAALENSKADETLTYTMDVMTMLTEIRKQWGFIYPFETK